MKTGTKVKIIDGGYMLTINDGQLSHAGSYATTITLGWCKDTFTIIDHGNYPAHNDNRKGFRNNTMIVNDCTGEVWFCSEINIRSAKRFTRKELYRIVGYEFDIID